MRIGILTGSGTYRLPGLEAADERTVVTAFGEVAASVARLGAVEVVHISRHGDGHHRVAHQVDHRANIAALRDLRVDGILAVTVCGGVDPAAGLCGLVVFDDLFFPSNRLPGGEPCTFHIRPGAPGRGHWVFDRPFSAPLRDALLDAARALDHPVRDGGVYGHVDGPRFNTRSEIAMLAAAGVTAVSQTAGPETVLAGEAEIPYALLGFVTDHANGVVAAATPVDELLANIALSVERFATTIAAALPRIDGAALAPVGTNITWD